MAAVFGAAAPPSGGAGGTDLEEWAEEQRMELEALESLYGGPGEFEVTAAPGSAGAGAEFRLRLSPNAPQVHVRAELHIKYTPEYPKEPPVWDLTSTGLEVEDAAELEKMVADAFADVCGAPMIFNVCEIISDFLADHNVPVASNHDLMMKRAELEKLQKQKEAVAGAAADDGAAGGAGDVGEFKGLEAKALCAADERITAEQFEQWRVKFREEMEASGVWGRQKQWEGKPTGKQMFLQHEQPEPTGGAAADAACFDKNLIMNEEELDDEDDFLDEDEDLE